MRAPLVISLLALAVASTAAAASVTAGQCRWVTAFAPAAMLQGERAEAWDLSSRSARDVWVVGEDDHQVGTSTTRSKPFAFYWDGTRWVPTPVPFTWGVVEHVVADGPHTAWAAVDTRDVGSLVRFDGTAWRHEHTPGDARPLTLGPGRFGRPWVLGTHVYEWAGGAWHRLDALGDPTRFTLYSTGPSVWRTESFGVKHTRPPIVERWDGAGWVSTPLRVSPQTDLYSLVSAAPRDAWLAGSDGNHGLLWHWDGQVWQRSPGPPFGSIDAQVALTGHGTLWVHGSKTNSAVTIFPPYLRHRTSSGWTDVVPPTLSDNASFVLYAFGGATWARIVLGGVRRLACG